jgi:hypothetical protein
MFMACTPLDVDGGGGDWDGIGDDGVSSGGFGTIASKTFKAVDIVILSDAVANRRSEHGRI